MNEALERAYRELRREYAAAAPERLAELRADAAALRRGEPAARASLVTRFHRLAGSAGSYGFPAISALAREAERGLGDGTIDVDRIDRLLDALAARFDDARRELEA